MVFRNRRRGNRRNRRSSGRNRAMTRKSKVDFTGIRSQPPRKPRSAQDAPWNSLTVQRTFTIADSSTFSVNIAYLRDVLANQIGATSDASLTFRILALDVYDLAGRPMELSSYDFTQGSAGIANSQLVTALSWPDRDGWSCARFTWPKAISATALSFSGTPTNVVVAGGVGAPIGINSVVTDKVLLRVRFLWRPTQAATVPALSVVMNPEPVSIKLEGCTKSLHSIVASDKTEILPVAIDNAIGKLSDLGIHMDSTL